MKVPACLAIAALGVALCGCATIIDGSSQKIAISTTPVRGAKCVLTTARGRLSVMTPGVVKVERSKHDIAIRCMKDGYETASAKIPSDMDYWTLGNLATVGLGAGVDAVTGSINDYPDSFRVPMKASNDSPSQQWNSQPAWDQPQQGSAPPAWDQPQQGDSAQPDNSQQPESSPDSGY